MLSGSPVYMDPSLFVPNVTNDVVENEKVDIWAIGIMAFELFTGYRPFNGNDVNQLIQLYNKATYVIDLNVCKRISKQLLSFFNMCLQRGQNTRADINELKFSEFITRDINSFDYIDLNNIRNVKIPMPNYVYGNGQLILNIDDKRALNLEFDK